MPAWRETRVAPAATHHLGPDGAPAYDERFLEVLAFHDPGLAPVRDATGAYHVGIDGQPAYPARFARTFGFYEGRAALDTGGGWAHVLPDATPLYGARYAWCGNFQGGRCAVRRPDGRYVHLDRDGVPVGEATWRYAGDYRDGIAVVQGEDGRSTHVDVDGSPVHGRWFQDLDVYHKGFARARDGAGWTHVDRSGRPVYRRRFVMVEPFYNGQARVEDDDGALLVIDQRGEVVHTLRPGRRPLPALSADMVGFWRTQTIAAAVELGVFDRLPGPCSALALPDDHAERLLRALGELGLVKRDGDAWQATTRGALLRTGEGMDAAARVWSGDHYETWPALARRLRGDDGGRRSYFDALPDSLREGYHRAMAAYAAEDYARLADVVDWRAHRRVVDAGGSLGSLLQLLLPRWPHLAGTVLDLPEVVALAEASTGIGFVGSDIRQSWPVCGDAVLLARVLHDWPDDVAVAILGHAARALDPGGRVYVLELVLDEDGVGGGLLDLNQLVMTGGRERTLAGWRALGARAGLSLSAATPLGPVVTVLAWEAA